MEGCKGGITVIKEIQRATATSPEGAKGLVKGILACALQNVSFMLPTSLLYFLVRDLMEGTIEGRTGFYVVSCIVCFVLIFLATWVQYNSTYFTTYKESGIRRLTLAEQLRKLPLSFFGKRDLADLTSTIMADCEVLEKTCSHFIPGLFGSLISTVLIALGLFLFDWRMALAALWVIPVSIAVLLGSYKVQDRVQARTMAVKMRCADGIQEYIETMRDLKASNAESGYLLGLTGKIWDVEKQTISAELCNAIFVTSAGMVLKLGIASVALTGSLLLINGGIDVLTLFLFLMVASRLYDPMQGALQNLAGGIMLMAFHPFKRGDFIDAAGVSGTVKEISLFYTLLCTADNKHITVPNGSLMNANVVNYSAEKYRRVDMVFSYDWDEDPVKIQNLLMSVLEKHPTIMKEEGKLPFARLSGGTDQSLAFTVRAWTLQENYWTVFYDLNQQITEITSENNIKAPSYRVIESK